MARLIPRKTKVKIQFYKNFSLTDVLVAFCCLVVVALAALSGLTFRYILAAGLGLASLSLFVSVAPETRLYQSIGHTCRFLFANKTYTKTAPKVSQNVKLITPYEGFIDFSMHDGSSDSDDISFIDYGSYLAAVIEIRPVQFYMLSEQRQNQFITAVDNALKTIAGDQIVSIVKTEKPLVLDSYLENEKKKAEDLLKSAERGDVTENELDPRLDIIESRMIGLENCNVGSPNTIMKEHYYFIIYGTGKEALKSSANLVATTLEGGTNNSLQCKILNKAELAIFLKSTYTDDFDEREIYALKPEEYLNWLLPNKVTFNTRGFVIDGVAQSSLIIADYPLAARNAWGNYFFNIPGSKVIVKFKSVGIDEAERRIDNAVMEMEAQYMNGGKSSKMLQLQTHIQTLNELLVSLKNGNEAFFDTSIAIICKQEIKKNVKTMLRRGGFKYNDLFCSQIDGFIAGNIGRKMVLGQYDRGINSSSLAAIFPFISDAVQDEKGFFLGYNSEPLFLDFFKRDKERINSNMVIIGKSGSGKSYATKGILSHLASDNSKIYVLDPEKEYDNLVHNLGGKLIDVGSAKMGRLNPFQVFTTLDDEGEEGQNTSLATHLQFLEQFFKIILDGITTDALEILNDCVKQVYDKFNINANTDIQNLDATQFPIFQDVYNFIVRKFNETKDDFYKNNLRIIITYLNKFVSGGRNSMLWNGYSSITAEENFIDFNFQSLLANKNGDIANAQMLLVLRWIDNEIIKNKDYNAKYNTKRKVVVAIDEAHVFIDPKKDVALDFMYNLAKRIRKYEGMQIIITQNLKDFVGTPSIARKSTAIINASQYSFIFSLAPHDINDLVELYEKAGRINEAEQESIVSSPRGRAFLITGPYSRTTCDVALSDLVIATFEKPDIKEYKRQQEELAMQASQPAEGVVEEAIEEEPFEPVNNYGAEEVIEENGENVAEEIPSEPVELDPIASLPKPVRPGGGED